MSVDIDRLQGLLKWAAEEDALRREGKPSHWSQAEWIRWDEQGNADLSVSGCGTVCCIAGKVALEEGARGVRRSDSAFMNFRVDVNGQHDNVSEVARNALGLSVSQAAHLFSGGNDLEDLRAIVGMIAAGLDEDALYDAVEEWREEKESR